MSDSQTPQPVPVEVNVWKRLGLALLVLIDSLFLGAMIAKLMSVIRGTMGWDALADGLGIVGAFIIMGLILALVVLVKVKDRALFTRLLIAFTVLFVAGIVYIGVMQLF
ncbi:MAG: hypothetical protein CL946_00215 [Ectothiorhodospiraceae bacterium]|nr:hypothetical protein [Ectothiorhodospiraceae bacterium]